MFVVSLKLYKSKKKVIGETENREDCFKIIVDYLKSIGCKYYYLRSWKISDDITKVDYGSHVDFFYIKQIGE